MSKYHVNPTTGKPGKCRAQAGKCPFGGADKHFDSPEAATQDYEKKNESLMLSQPVRDKMSRIEKMAESATTREEKEARLDELKSVLSGTDSSIDINGEEFDEHRTAAAGLQSELAGGQKRSVDTSAVISDVQEPDGGATWSINEQNSPTSGFAYSPYPERSEVIEKADDVTPQALMDYYNKNKDVMEKEGHYFGMWNDPQTGKVYLDVSVHTFDAAEARQGCKDKDQIAFFDFQTFNSVTVDQNAKSGQS